MPEQRAAPKYNAQPGRGCPTSFRAGLFGKGSCRWQARVPVSKPTAKPSQCTRWQQEAPNRGGGDDGPDKDLSNRAEETRKHPSGM